MPQLLIELFSEEIPARMQAQAARDLDRMVRERLAEQGLLPEGLKTFAGPRRLTLVAEGLPAAQGDRHSSPAAFSRSDAIRSRSRAAPACMRAGISSEKISSRSWGIRLR